MYYIAERVWRGLMRENFEYRDFVPGLPVITYWIYEQACSRFDEYEQSEEGFAYAIADAIKRYVDLVDEESPSSYRVRCSDGEMWPCHRRTLEYVRYIGHIIKVLGSFDREKSDQEKAEQYQAIVDLVKERGFNINPRYQFVPQEQWPEYISEAVGKWRDHLKELCVVDNITLDDRWFLHFEAALARRIIERTRNRERVSFAVDEVFVMDVMAEIDCTFMFGHDVKLQTFSVLLTKMKRGYVVS
jgi:hypothetical protein